MRSQKRQIGVLNIEIEKTRAYYKSVHPEDLCDCEGCRNYRARIKQAYPGMAEYLDSLGIDIEKPFHVSYVDLPNEPDSLLYIGCCYAAFGDCSLDFSRQVDGLEFTRAGACPDPGVTDPHIELQIAELKLPFHEEEYK